ncbi:hypothetical protein [Halobacillus litoralis]|uniref:hypothetical protein n=1 Tax=Halobacillus litoralis TaxID=45668 RepID=UPI001CFF3698|nr:hypothetical protein [Halobacillus litoralis]
MYGQGFDTNGYQANPNSYDECSRCGKPLATKVEEELNLCKECQRRQEDHKVEKIDD